MGQSPKITTKLVRPLRGGQITIPAEFRRSLGIDDETMLRMTLVDGELRIVPVSIGERMEGSRGLKDLYDYFAPTREAILSSGVTEDELVADIRAAVAEVRASSRAERG